MNALTTAAKVRLAVAQLCQFVAGTRSEEDLTVTVEITADCVILTNGDEVFTVDHKTYMFELAGQQSRLAEEAGC